MRLQGVWLRSFLDSGWPEAVGACLGCGQTWSRGGRGDLEQVGSSDRGVWSYEGRGLRDVV